MADPATYRPRTSDIPTNPGVYRFRDDQGRVIYVGKAKNLRARLVNYFQDLSALHPRTQQMVTTASSVQWTVVASEVEALTLEFTWIKEFAPRFNVIYKDDKSYPYLSVSLNERFPRVKVTREAKKKGERYYGPYTQVWAIRESIDLLLRVYPVRTCSPGVFSRAKAQGRPCLLADIGKCSAPCVGRISEDDHRSLAVDLCRFMDGRTGPVIRDLEEKMRHASANLEFEQAGAYRDDIAALQTVLERNTMVLDDGTDADIFALAVDDLDAAVHVFHVRGGRVRGTRSWVISRIDDASEEQLMARLLEQAYGELPVMQSRRSTQKSVRTSVDDVEHTPTRALPREVLVSVLPEDAVTVTQWLTQRRGAKVMLRVPERGPKAALMETVMTNARQALALHKTKRAGDLTERSRALEVLRTELGLDHAPLRIECFDVSHTAGTHRVASMVVFEDGIPRKDAYRSFIIRGDASQNADDTAAMQEVLIRRFSRLAAEMRGEDGIDDEGVSLESGPIDPSTGKARRFSYKPDLVLVDGGPLQVASACAALEQVGITLPVVGLAKRLEELWMPGQAYPVILPRTSPGLYLLQHLRDESHRFAISAHRKKRSKAQTRSILDDISGLGAARQRALLKAFGSVKRLREADADQIAKVDGIGPRLAQSIVEGLRQGTMESSST